jgi:hypothetical protein
VPRHLEVVLVPVVSLGLLGSHVAEWLSWLLLGLVLAALALRLLAARQVRWRWAQ